LGGRSREREGKKAGRLGGKEEKNSGESRADCGRKKGKPFGELGRAKGRGKKGGRAEWDMHERVRKKGEGERGKTLLVGGEKDKSLPLEKPERTPPIGKKERVRSGGGGDHFLLEGKTGDGAGREEKGGKSFLPTKKGKKKI